ncbi:hypothetical protein [Kosakonia quasisacchari]|uniref:hypothetical protein n=1 Tax=Kosakonia quasisacchari TaxID=2529380 RepID=UPI0039E1080D
MIDFNASYAPFIKVEYVYSESNGNEIIAKWPMLYMQDTDGGLMRQSAGWVRCSFGEVIGAHGQLLAKDEADFAARYFEVVGRADS